jgi:integrase/recombinase XerD
MTVSPSPTSCDAIAAALPEQTSPEARQLGALWLLSFRNAGTRRGYTRDLSVFLAWCAQQNLDPFGVRRAHVEAHLADCDAAGLSAATVARRAAALRSFYAYAMEESDLARNPATRIRRAVPQDSQTLGLEISEIRTLLRAAEASGPRDAALVALLYLNGLRVSEACGADVEGLGLSDGTPTLAVLRKGGATQAVALSQRCALMVAGAVAGRSCGPLLVSRQGRRLSARSAGFVIKRLAVEAGIEKRIHPHSLRHSLCTHALAAGVPLHQVQDTMAHADPRTTQRYNRARHLLADHAGHVVAALLDD